MAKTLVDEFNVRKRKSSTQLNSTQHLNLAKKTFHQSKEVSSSNTEPPEEPRVEILGQEIEQESGNVSQQQIVNTTPIMPASTSSNQNATSTPSASATITQNQQAQPLLKKGKTLSEYLFDWLSRTKFSTEYARSDCKIDLALGTMKCTACNLKHIFKVYDANGCWKLPNHFIGH